MFKLKTVIGASLLAAAATTAFAYSTNPDVQKRQETMGMISSGLKKLMPMVQGKADFDAATAQAAFAQIAEYAGNIPTAFEANTTDAESKASPAIWENWDDFTTKASALEAGAKAGMGVDSLEAMQAAFGPVGGACKACHTTYKK
ncbi:MAG: cytochrome c [Maritimibacter sp.]|jgi:cytochrome c556